MLVGVQTDENPIFWKIDLVSEIGIVPQGIGDPASPILERIRYRYKPHAL